MIYGGICEHNFIVVKCKRDIAINKVFMIMNFSQLTKDTRKNLYDQWLLTSCTPPIKSWYYRSNVHLYEYSNPSELIQAAAIQLQQEDFIEKDRQNVYSTPLRRYLEWVYDYVLKDKDDELLKDFCDALAIHENLFIRGR